MGLAVGMGGWRAQFGSVSARCLFPMQLEISRRCSQMCVRELCGDGSSWPRQPPGTSNSWNG